MLANALLLKVKGQPDKSLPLVTSSANTCQPKVASAHVQYSRAGLSAASMTGVDNIPTSTASRLLFDPGLQSFVRHKTVPAATGLTSVVVLALSAYTKPLLKATKTESKVLPGK